ncbi:MAG: flagellar basal body rod protein FlgC [Schwartzia sp.]|nr:flagellar basal body rod protein FlgC [Schwartzia sp. (in: firmicutes)]MBR1759835.1 flagellar basal body rod protein FlgC [Schwartzia sp. (in: firmicutes)]MBR1886536.1 flagellar basal body rod protein FlgC [Schwartzia sp. (in: firmicutes)]
MSMFGGIDTSASGLTAERLRMDVISNNLANANTTRTPEGGAYHRRYVVFQPREYDEQKGFGFFMAHALRAKNSRTRERGNGVRAVRIEEDRSQGPLVYDPGHPDANAEGYVERPNVNAVAEMVDLITASRAYEANVTAINAAKAMANQALDIGRS